MFIIAIFAALIALFTAATDRAVDGAKGFKAPVFKIERADSLVQLDNLKGEWVLLQFWSSADASSRLAAKEYSRLHSAVNQGAGQERFRHLAVNFDRSSRHSLSIPTERSLPSILQPKQSKKPYNRLPPRITTGFT